MTRLDSSDAHTGRQADPPPSGMERLTLALRMDQLAAALGVSRSTIERERAAGRFPPRVLLGVCVRPGCDAGWTVLYYARGDQRWSDQPYARVSCPTDPPPAVSPLRLHSPRT